MGLFKLLLKNKGKKKALTEQGFQVEQLATIRHYQPI